MAAKKTNAKASAKKTAVLKGARKPRTERKFPALTFEEALEIPEGIQKYAAGQKVRRLTLFEKLNKEPDSLEARQLITASGQYGLTKGGYQAEFLELTPEGNDATSDVVTPAKKLMARFELAIKKHGPFAFLYEQLKGNRLPAKEVMADRLSEADVEEGQKAECIDKFILNAKFLRLLKIIGGSERIIPIEQAVEEAASESGKKSETTTASANPTFTGESTAEAEDFTKICFYITPIGEEESRQCRAAAATQRRPPEATLPPHLPDPWYHRRDFRQSSTGGRYLRKSPLSLGSTGSPSKRVAAKRRKPV